MNDFEEFEDQDITEPDPGMVAHLDQEQAAFDEMRDEFAQTFGFNHKCRCAEDYGAGKLVEVTECFAEMVGEALATCQKLVQENEVLRLMLGQAFEVLRDKEIADAQKHDESDEGQENN